MQFGRGSKALNDELLESGADADAYTDPTRLGSAAGQAISPPFLGQILGDVVTAMVEVAAASATL